MGLTYSLGGGIIKKMKKIIIYLIVCVMPCLANAYINRDAAVLRVMNKDAGKVQEIVIPVGQEIQFEKLFINMRTCKQSDPFDAENFWAFVEIAESDKGLLFSNWMNRNEPGENPLQHPDYDVWLVRCE
ncbi:MAG: DUF2155 domain-containing protein [Alphaproteobacteria bacterium]|nr:DUF2155 domain-containing protein [Alphaproteobacteria bacterium]